MIQARSKIKWSFCKQKRLDKEFSDLAEEKIMKHLDIEAFLRKQITFDILLKTVFTKTERFFIKKNKKFSFYAPSSASSDDENQLPEYFNTRSKYFQKLFDDAKLEDFDSPIRQYFQKPFDDTKLEDLDNQIPAINDISNYSINSIVSESVLSCSK